MFIVKAPDEILPILYDAVSARPQPEIVPLSLAMGRTLFSEIHPDQYVPAFHRSTVDGYAVCSADTFGCSDSLPALLTLCGEVVMGQDAPCSLSPGQCMVIPTGGALPTGADAVVMLEYTEAIDGTLVGINRPVSPAENVIFRGDDLSPNRVIFPSGHRLRSQDLGVLAALGYSQVTVCKRPSIAIISTGDELVGVEETPAEGQVRDINSSVLTSLCSECGAYARPLGIVKDDESVLGSIIDRAVTEYDMILLSGGSSVGVKDAVCRLLEARGHMLFHGIAMKPGKPTMFAMLGNTPVFGLPGHPAAAFLSAHLFVRPLIAHMMGSKHSEVTVPAILTEAVSANHGRAQYTAVSLHSEGDILYAAPIRGASGLISSLALSDGYFCIERDCEGMPKGAQVTVIRYVNN